MTARNSLLISLFLAFTAFGYYYLVIELGLFFFSTSSSHSSWRLTLLYCCCAAIIGGLFGCRTYRSLPIFAAIISVCSGLLLLGLFWQGCTLFAVPVTLCLALGASKSQAFLLSEKMTDHASRRRYEIVMTVIVIAELAVLIMGT